MTHLHTIARFKPLLIVIAFAFPISFLAAIPWLKNQPDSLVYLLAGIAATGTVVASFLLAIIKDTKLDEWHRTAERFSVQWGFLLGGGLVAILLAVPPVQHLIVSLAGAVADVATPDAKLVLLSFSLGLMSVILLQGLCMVILNFGWQRWMSGPSD